MDANTKPNLWLAEPQASPNMGDCFSEKRTDSCKPRTLHKYSYKHNKICPPSTPLHNTANQIYFQTVKSFPQMGSLTRGRPLGNPDRMQRGYFKTGALSSILRSSVIGFGR